MNNMKMKVVPYHGDFKTFWMSVGVFSEYDYQDWVQLGVISPALLNQWLEIGVDSPRLLKTIKRHNINTPFELERELYMRSLKFCGHYTLTNLLSEWNELFYDEYDEDDDLEI